MRVAGWLLKWLNLITAPGSVSNELGQSHDKQSSIFEKAMLSVAEIKLKNNYIVTTEYIIFA